MVSADAFVSVSVYELYDPDTVWSFVDEIA